MNRPRHRLQRLVPPVSGALFFAFAGAAAAQDRAELDRTQITGHRELPKVLYIVPWKKPEPLTMGGRPVASVVDEALAPVDREVFRRQIRYDAQLRAQGAPPPSPTPSPSR